MFHLLRAHRHLADRTASVAPTTVKRLAAACQVIWETHLIAAPSV